MVSKSETYTVWNLNIMNMWVAIFLLGAIINNSMGAEYTYFILNVIKISK